MAKRIAICEVCRQPEYYENFLYFPIKLDGHSGGCRNCYRKAYEIAYHKPCDWDYLDERKPTYEEYMSQELADLEVGDTNETVHE